jgi:hypothetical protein
MSELASARESNGVIGPVPQPKNILLSPIQVAAAFSGSRSFAG